MKNAVSVIASLIAEYGYITRSVSHALYYNKPDKCPVVLIAAGFSVIILFSA